jgi:N-formylglutamate deformylase
MSVKVETGDSPLVLAQPHGGTEVPQTIFDRLNDNGRALADTDWHIYRLYNRLVDSATIVRTTIHRYVIDANRDPSDQSLYPGQNTTSLCPTTSFDGEPIYLPGEEPNEDEIQTRQQQFHQTYHDALREQLDRVHQKHGFAILYDCHSIRSLVPYLFEDKLPDFNIGTNSGESCSSQLESTVLDCCAQQKQFSHVLNGRFKGGWTTRHYGEPEAGFHAIQMELAQCTYMQEQGPWRYDTGKAKILRKSLKAILLDILKVDF